MSGQGVELLQTPGFIAIVATLAVFEFGLMIWAVVDWARRPADQVRGNRILWLLLIVLVNIVGPVVYLTVGRMPAQVDDPLLPGSSADRARDAVSSLYGSGGKESGPHD